MPYCLIPELAAKFRRMIKSGDIDLIGLQNMSSEQRRQVFSTKLGSVNANELNALYEKKLLAKNRKKALLSFIKEASGLSPEVRRDFITRANRLGDLLTEEDINKYKEDLINKRLRIGVTQEQGKKIYELASLAEKNMEEAKKIPGIENVDYDFENETAENKKIRREAGASVAILQEYVESITEPSVRTTITDVIENPRMFPVFLGNINRAIVASWDNSFFLNQGSKVMANPFTFTKWLNAFNKSWGDIGRSLKGDNVGLAVKSEIYSRPNFINGNYTRMRLAVGLRTEEAIPTSLPEKIPALGRIFKASNAAYNGAALRLRADLADYFIKIQTKDGLSFKDKEQAKSFGIAVNSLTGRGSTKMSQDNAELVNAIIFSPTLLKSNIDAVTFFQGKSDMTKEASSAAAKYIAQIVFTQAIFLAIMKVLYPDNVELDPRSTNFGGVKIGNTWFKNPVMTAGGVVPLLFRIAIPTMHNGKWGLWFKNIKGKYSMLLDFSELRKGIISKKPKGFKPRIASDVLWDFIAGKTAPMVRNLLTIWEGETYGGKKVTPKTLLKENLPISPKEIYELANDPKTEYLALWSFLALIGGQTNK